MSEKISLVIPVYKGELFILELIDRIRKVVSSIDLEYEIILVNDASPDDSWQLINEACKSDSAIKGINLSRNFGQHYAITAGLHYCSGDWVVVMDCDLQDIPEEIPTLISKAKDGYDAVLAVRENRQDNFLKKLFSQMFYSTLSWLSGVKYDYRIANFGIYNRKVINAILSMGDSIRYFPSMVKWVGFNQAKLKIRHDKRASGKSSYNFKRLMNLALDIILSYSDKPIRLTIRFGLIISLSSILFTIYTLIQYLNGVILVPGYTSLIISIWFFSGFFIASLGIVGLYVSKTFEATKKRPLFIPSDLLNLED